VAFTNTAVFNPFVAAQQIRIDRAADVVTKSFSRKLKK
jgi:hypothetical protein